MASKAVSAHIQKSLSRLKSAQLLLDNDMHEEAIGAAYYAVFHAISAVLADKGLEYNSHKGVISNFNKEFVHTGLIGSISAKALSSLHVRRNESEYDIEFLVGEDGARSAVEQATVAVQDIADYCRLNNIGGFPS